MINDSDIDHGNITGLSDDDHIQYLKERAYGGTGTEVPVHTHSSTQGGQLDWDDVWLDAVHNHQSVAEGGTLSEASFTLTDVTTNDVNTSRHGLCPKAPNDTSKFLRGDGTWSTISSTAHDLLSSTHSDTIAGTPVAGDIVIASGSPAKWSRLAKGSSYTFLMMSGSGLPAWTYIDLNMHCTGVLGFIGGGTGNGGLSLYSNEFFYIYSIGSKIEPTGVKLNISSPTNGQVLRYNSSTDRWVNSDASSGDVIGPSSSTDNAIVRFDGTTGKAIQNSGVTINDNGDITANCATFTDTAESLVVRIVASGTNDPLHLGRSGDVYDNIGFQHNGTGGSIHFGNGSFSMASSDCPSISYYYNDSKKGLLVNGPIFLNSNIYGKYEGTFYSGKDGIYSKVITDLRWYGSTLQYKYGGLIFYNGICVYIGSESDWVNVV